MRLMTFKKMKEKKSAFMIQELFKNSKLLKNSLNVQVQEVSSSGTRANEQILQISITRKNIDLDCIR